MSDPVAAIAQIRDAVCAVLRIAPGEAAGQFQLNIVGTAWCVANSSVFVTAHHVFNGGQARDPAHRFYLLRTPANGHALQYWPVAGFSLEDPDRDLALLTAPGVVV